MSVSLDERFAIRSASLEERPAALMSASLEEHFAGRAFHLRSAALSFSAFRLLNLDFGSTELAAALNSNTSVLIAQH